MTADAKDSRPLDLAAPINLAKNLLEVIDGANQNVYNCFITKRQWETARLPNGCLSDSEEVSVRTEILQDC